MAILKRHLVDKVPGCDLCDELGLNPTVFYGWQKLLFERLSVKFPHELRGFAAHAAWRSWKGMTRRGGASRRRIK